jgi:hypothetical protein
VDVAVAGVLLRQLSNRDGNSHRCRIRIQNLSNNRRVGLDLDTHRELLLLRFEAWDVGLILCPRAEVELNAGEILTAVCRYDGRALEEHALQTIDETFPLTLAEQVEDLRVLS